MDFHLPLDKDVRRSSTKLKGFGQTYGIKNKMLEQICRALKATLAAAITSLKPQQRATAMS